VANAVVTLPDGRYVVAGSSTTVIGQGVVARYNANGTLDQSFGAGGTVASSLFPFGFQDAVALGDGSILATGQVVDNFGNQYFGVLKLAPSGFVDETFGIRGLAIADFATEGGGYTGEFPRAITLQGTSIVVAGDGVAGLGDLDMLVARFTNDGNLDNTFDANGRQEVFFDLSGTFNDQAFDVAIDNSNKIVLAGSADFGDLDFAIARLTNTGVLDTTFDADGKKSIDFGGFFNNEAFSVAIESSGNILLGGYTVSPTTFFDDFALTRLNNSGALLAGFGTNGTVTTDFGTQNEPSQDRIQEIKIQGNQVVVAGFANQVGGALPNQTFAMARYAISTGTLDATLDQNSGNGGRVRTSFFADYFAAAGALGIDSSGNYILVGASGGVAGVSQNWGLARYLSTGIIDPTFGNQGRVLTDHSFWNGISHDLGNAAFTMADGRTVVVGTSSLFAGGTYGTIARYLPDGRLDPTFGANGEVASPFFAGGFQDVTVFSDGSVLATGQVNDNFGNSYFGLLKLTPNGFIDESFGIRGLALADFGAEGPGYFAEFPKALTLQGTSIVVAGDGVSPSGDRDMLIARFDSDGNLDNTFDGDGLQEVAFDLGGVFNDLAFDVAIDNSNKIVVAGSADFGDLDMAVARLTSTGTLDTTFDSDGRKTVDFGNLLNDEAFSLAIEASGNILLGGYTVSLATGFDDFALTRLNNSGAVLAGFGANGLVTTDFGTQNEPSQDRIQEIRIQGTQVVVGGFANQIGGALPNQTFALARYTISNGTLDANLDTTSGNGGRVRVNFFATTISTATALTFDASGNYILVGSSGDGFLANNFALAKLTTAGVPDSSFGNLGRVLTDFSPIVGPNDVGTSVAIAPDGDLIVAGSSVSPFGVTTGILARYNPDGSLDSTFGSGGQVGSALFPFGFADVLTLPDGSILAIGQVVDTAFNEYFGVLKLTPNGFIDESFGIRGLAVADFGPEGVGYTGELPRAVTLQGTSIVVAGDGVSFFGDRDMLVARFTSDGNLDNTFDADGRQEVLFNLGGTFDDRAFDVAIDNNNKIVLAGGADFLDLDFAIARLTTTGVLDTTFDADGLKTIDFGGFLNNEAFSVAIESSGNILLGGYTVSPATGFDDFALTRLNNSGGLLAGFGTNGTVTTDFGTQNEPSQDRIQEIKIQGGQVVVAGFSNQVGGVLPNQTFAIARYTINTGVLDNTVDPDTGNGGRVRTSFFAASTSNGQGVAIDANGNWVVVGSAGDGVFADNVAIARFEDPPIPTVTLSATPLTISESGGTTTITATLSSKSIVPVTVDLQFSGSATFTTDYLRSGTQIVIPAGLLSASITVTGVGDASAEGNETVIVAITAVTNGQEQGAQQVTVTINDDDNLAPTDINLSNSSVNENAANAVIGSLTSTDTAGDTHTYTIVNTLSGNLFTIAGNQLRVGATGLNFEALSGGTAQVRVRSTDQGNLSFEKTFTISVTDINETPSIAAGQSFTIAENLSNGSTIGTVTSADPDSSAPFNSKNFSLSSNPNGAFAINATTGQLTVASSAGLNFEAGSSITVSVTVTDGGSLSATQNVTVNLTDVNEAPSIAAGQSFSVNENSAANVSVGTVASADPDGSAPFNTKAFSLSSNPNGAFAINSATGQLTVANSAALNFEAGSSIVVGVTVTDGGSLSATQNVTVNLTDVNEAPSIAAGQSFSINENSTNGTTVGLVTSSDPDTSAPFNTKSFSLSSNPNGAFSINAAGQLSVANSAALNFEAGNSITVGVTVTDGGSLSATQNVTVNLNDVNEAPSIAAGQSFTINENSANNTSVGTVTSVDPDTTSPFNTKSFSITGGNTGNVFAINAATGVVTVANQAGLNFETSPSFTLQITVTDGGNLQATQAVSVTVNDVNEAPVIPAGQSFTLNENSAANTVVGTIVSSDPDTTAPANTRTFSISSGNLGNAFSINSITGQIRVNSSAALDFETTPTFDLQIAATDGGGLVTNQTVTVELTNVNETPVLGAPGSAQPFSKRGKIPTQVFPSITVNDTDGATDLTRLTITVSLPRKNNGTANPKPKDVVTFDGASSLGSVSDTRVGTTRTLTINLNASTTTAQIQTFLRGIRFSSAGSSINAKNLSRSFNVTVLDKGGVSTSVSQTVNVVK